VTRAQSANLVAMAILLFATYGFGTYPLKPVPAAAAAVLVNFYPYLLWLIERNRSQTTAHEHVALAMLVSHAHERLCGSEALHHLRRRVRPRHADEVDVRVVPLLPTLCCRKNIKNAAISAGTAAVLAGYWYIHALAALAQLLIINTAGR